MTSKQSSPAARGPAAKQINMPPDGLPPYIHFFPSPQLFESYPSHSDHRQRLSPLSVVGTHTDSTSHELSERHLIPHRRRPNLSLKHGLPQVSRHADSLATTSASLDSSMGEIGWPTDTTKSGNGAPASDLSSSSIGMSSPTGRGLAVELRSWIAPWLAFPRTTMIKTATVTAKRATERSSSVFFLGMLVGRQAIQDWGQHRVETAWRCVRVSC